jgi:hypothetical protein
MDLASFPAKFLMKGFRYLYNINLTSIGFLAAIAKCNKGSRISFSTAISKLNI